MNTSRTELQRRIATCMRPLNRRWSALGDQVLATLGVSNSQGWCLVYLSRLGPETRQSEIAHALGMREASLVPTLAQLEHAGLVERHPCPQDARAKHTQLTGRGNELARQIETMLEDLRSELFDGVPEEDLQVTLRVIETLSERVARKFP